MGRQPYSNRLRTSHIDVVFLVLGFLGLLLATATLRADPLQNGSFETGNFTGWTRSGFYTDNGGPTTGAPTYATFLSAQAAASARADANAVTTAQTTAFDSFGVASAAVFPTNGSYLGFVSNATSAGNFMLTGSSISQSFTIPIGATVLTLDVALLNNDVTSSLFARFDDFGGVSLTFGTAVLSQYNLDLAPGTSANVHVTADANAGGFRNSTGWQRVSFNVAPYQGQTLSLTAYSVQYGGDNSVESRLLIDNVVVPEPSALIISLLALAGAAGCVLARRLAKPTTA